MKETVRDLGVKDDPGVENLERSAQPKHVAPNGHQ
jgi:hypothetical protein